MGFLIGVNQPARLALFPALVGREHLPTAIALNSVVFNSAGSSARPWPASSSCSPACRRR
jgi:hypothetical protein